MSKIPAILPMQPPADSEYDIAIATLGYESRSSYLAKHLDPKASVKVAAGFKDRHVLHYLDNRAWHIGAGYKVKEVDDVQYRSWCADIINRIRPRRGATARFWVDISSVSRLRMAILLESMRSARFPIVADFFYAIAKFSNPEPSIGPNCHVGPVTTMFSGWSDPSRQAVAIVGLGYEQNKALGAVEHIQATDVWTFIPHSEIREYTNALFEANSILLEKIPKQRQVEYFVERPFDCFVILESLVNRIAETQVPVLFPFGPKIFSLCAMLVGCIHSMRVAVWRVSAGQYETALEREPKGSYCGLRVAFQEQQRSLSAAEPNGTQHGNLRRSTAIA
jgi:hypothetical protein